ncbi:DUF6887 family protein [Nostoc sp.]
MKPDFSRMTRQYLRAYILAHSEDIDCNFCSTMK